MSDKPSNLSELTGEIKGWQDARQAVRASLQQYPNAGGDITIMAEVERILAAKDEEVAWLRKERQRHLVELKAAECERDSFRDQLIWIRRHATAQLAEMKAERDSLREELVQAKCLLIRAADDLAALKAGKDGQQ